MVKNERKVKKGKKRVIKHIREKERGYLKDWWKKMRQLNNMDSCLTPFQFVFLKV